MDGSLDIGLAMASYCVAVAAAYAALDLGSRVSFFEGRHRTMWLLAGACVMGTGTWATYVVALKSLQLPFALTFDLGIMVLAWLAACVASLMALRHMAGTRLGPGGLAAGGALIGCGITLMSIGGISALRLTPAAQTNIPAVVLSLVFATGCATASLFLAFRRNKMPTSRATGVRLASALILGVGICGQYFIGFKALTISRSALPSTGNLLTIEWMGPTVALLTCSMLAITIWLSVLDARLVLDRRQVSRTRAKAERTHRLAHYDSATGLPNRSLFLEKLLKQLVHAHNRDHIAAPVGIVYAELANYRNLVAHLGQERLNRLLRALAVALTRTLQPGDVLARLACDGLVLMVHEKDTRTTAAALSAFSAQLSTPLHDNGESFRFTWAIGSSRYPEDGDSTHGLVRAAMTTRHYIGSEVTTRTASTTSRYAVAS